MSTPEDIILDIETTCIKPHEGRITMIGVAGTIGGMQFFCELDEDKMLERFMHEIRTKRPMRVIGWHISDFDIPWIKIKCLKHKVSVTGFPTMIEDLRNHFVIDDLSLRNLLEDVLRENYLPNTPSADMPVMWEKKNYAAIRHHLGIDLINTRNLYTRMWELGMI